MKKRLYKITSLILALMLLLSCFTPMTMAAEKTEDEVGASSYTVYFDDQANLYEHGNVYCYMWNESTTGANAEWPGKKMSYDNSTGYYYYNSTVKYERCIFSVGNGDPNYDYGQTYNLDVCYGYVFVCDGYNYTRARLEGAWKEYISDPYVDFGSYSIYMRNSANWTYSGDTMYLYAWNDSGSVIGVWPGVKMTNLGNGIYRYTSTTRYDNCIFSEGGDSAYNHQSPDMTARYGYIYDNAEHTWELYETPPTTAPVTTVKPTVPPTTVPPTTVAPTTVVPTTVVPTTVAPTTEPVQKYVNIFGDINIGLTDNGIGVYSGTVELEAGSYSFRVDENGTQMCFGYTFKDSMSNVTYSPNYTSATTLNATGGYYTFKYNSTTNRLSVSYVPYPTEEVTAPITEPVTTEEPTEAPTTIPVTEPTEPITTIPVTEPTEAPETVPVTEPITTEPVTEPITTEPITEPETTEPITVPVKEELTVNATSNFFTSQTATYNRKTRELTVTYYIDAEKDMLNTQWELTYDPAILTVSSEKNTRDSVSPEFKQNRVLTFNDGKIKCNTYNLSLYDISSEEKVFARVVFDVNDFRALGVYDTTINLNVQHLTLSTLDDETGISDMNEEVRVVYNGAYDDSDGLINTARTEFVSVEIPEFIGDVDGSGDINIHDATLIAKYLVEYADLDEGQLLVSDCDGDGIVTIKDVTCIQLYIADATNSGNTGQKYE